MGTMASAWLASTAPVVSYYLKNAIETHYHIKEQDQLFPLEKVKSWVYVSTVN